MRRGALSVADRIPTDGGGALRHNPFGALDGAVLPLAPAPSRTAGEAPAPRSRGRVDVTREVAGRAGKTVTVAGGFAGIGLAEKQRLLSRIRAACGCGGTVKEGRIEIQGDQREAVCRILSEAGFRPVLAGG